jgi:GNAT superfamily N-acetyltransferase
MSLTISNLRPEHARQLRELQLRCFPDVPPDLLFSEDDFVCHAHAFPELVFVAIEDDTVVGLGAGIFVDFDFSRPHHTIESIIGGGKCRNHSPDGAYYYGTDISVHPGYRRRGIGQKLYQLRKDVVIRYNKKGIVAGGMLPGYGNYKTQMTANLYVEKVVRGEFYDPTLTFQLQNGFNVRGVLKDYFYDHKTEGWASLLVWENPHYVESSNE